MCVCVCGYTRVCARVSVFMSRKSERNESVPLDEGTFLPARIPGMLYLPPDNLFVLKNLQIGTGFM